ncbi:MAG TPA: GNAT family N-acetyltransferase, partial [Actinopolymorphaceae bacterium]
MADPSITIRRAEAHASATRSAWQAWVGATLAGSAQAGPAARPQDRFVRLEVDPSYRRSGVGSALARAVAEDLAAQGCDALWTMVVVGTEGEAFASRCGAEVGDELVDDVLHFDELDTAELRALAAADRPGYALDHWCRR